MTTDTELLALIAEHDAGIERVNAMAGTTPADEFDILVDEYTELEERIALTPTSNPTALLWKLRQLRHGRPDDGADLESTLARGLRLDLERMAAVRALFDEVKQQAFAEHTKRPNPDAELLSLGTRWEALRAERRRCDAIAAELPLGTSEYEAASLRAAAVRYDLEPIETGIRTTAATTFAGLAIKLRMAEDSAQNSVPEKPDGPACVLDIEDESALDWEWRVVRSVRTDLERLAGAA